MAELLVRLLDNLVIKITELQITKKNRQNICRLIINNHLIIKVTIVESTISPQNIYLFFQQICSGHELHAKGGVAERKANRQR